jgi:hypothetical protein
MKIKRQDKITLFSALLVGVITGSYLYVVGFAPEFESSDVLTSEEVAEFALIGERYTSDETGIPASFQLRDDGSYRYLPASPDPASPLPAQEGELPREQMNQVRDVIPEDTLTRLTALSAANCVVEPGTVLYRYFITLAGVEYQVESCSEAYSTEPQVDTVLRGVWDTMLTDVQ